MHVGKENTSTMSRPKTPFNNHAIFQLAITTSLFKPTNRTFFSLIHLPQRSRHRRRLSSGRRGSFCSSKVVNAVAGINATSTTLPQLGASISKLPAAVNAGNAHARHIRDDSGIDLVNADLASRASLGVDDEAAAGFSCGRSRQSRFRGGNRGSRWLRIAVTVVGVVEIAAVEVVGALCACETTADNGVAGTQAGASGILAG